MVPEVGGRSKNESMKVGFECLTRSSEVEKAIAVIQVVGRGLCVCNHIVQLLSNWVSWDKCLFSYLWILLLYLTYKL